MGWKEIWARLAPKVISLSTSMEGTSPYIVEKSDAISSGDKDTLRNIQDKEGSLARKAAAAQLGLAVAPQILPVIANPATASTTAGAVATTGLDAAGLVGGLNQFNNYWNNRKNLTWNDTPGIILSGLSLVPGSSQLTNPRNWAVAANTIKGINPAFRYRTLLERVKTNPELAPYYDDAASAKIKFTLKNDGNYNPDTHTVELPIFGNNRTIAHEMGHAGLRGGELDIPNYDYDGTGLNKPNEAAADWFAGNLNERYYGKDAVMQVRQNAVDNFDIIRHSLADGTLRFGEPATYNGVHQSSKSIQQFEFPYQRWDVINHGADPNGAFFTLNKPAESGFLAKRPYTSYWEIKSQKPLIQTGEIRGPGNSKNNVRNAIVDYARRNGADAIEFRGIADNNLQNQNVLFATDKSGIRLKYESPVTEEASIVPQKVFASKGAFTGYDPDMYTEKPMQAIKDFKFGRQEAWNYLGSKRKQKLDAYNEALLKRIVESNEQLSSEPFLIERNPQLRSMTPMQKPATVMQRNPDATWIGNNDDGFFLFYPKGSTEGETHIVENLPASSDQVYLSPRTSLDDSAFHEYLHRGKVGDAKGLAGWLYQWKMKHLMKPQNDIDPHWREYVQKPQEAVNFIEIGRKAGIENTPYPGPGPAKIIIKHIIDNDTLKGGLLNSTKWETKPKRVWDALQGKYIGLIPIGLGTSLILNENENENK